MHNLSGRTFGSYLLEEPLGRGGMGEVYRARHVRLTNRRAAVKVLPSSLASEPDFLRRFEHEANSAAALDHPNILAIWEYGEQDGMPFLAMPLIAGGSLKDLLERRGALTLPEASRLLTQLADALDYAHGRGIIHRDVKPANILLTEEGRPLLADFGIAKAVETGQTQITRAGTGVGTPEYMAPEQLEGRAERRSDLYSLGVVLYQMLTGQVPYTGSTPYEVAYKQLQAPLPPLSQRNPRVPAAVERVLERALAKDPAARYGSARELATAFNTAIAGVADVHGQRTGPFILTPAPPAVVEAPEPTRVLPAPAPAPRRVAVAPVEPPVAVPMPPVNTPPPPQAGKWPLAVAALLGLLLLLGLGGFFALNRATPTPTVAPPDFAATGTALAASVNSAVQATATTGAAAAQTAAALAGGTATAAAGSANATTAAQVAQATTAAQVAQATAAAQAAQATAAAQAASAATATVAGAIQATQTVVAGATATAAAKPSPTPSPPPPTPAPPTPTPPNPTAWGPTLQPLTGGKAYADPQGRFAFAIPQDWTQAQVQGATVAFQAPRTGNQSVPTTMSVALDNTGTPPPTLDAYGQALEAQLKQQYPDYKQVSLDKVVIAGHPAYRRVFTLTASGTPLQIEQVYFLSGATAHLLTFATSPNAFAGQQRTFDGIAGSYKAGQ